MSAEIGAHADFSQLRYAQCWEDADLLPRALALQPQQSLLSIASAGDNTLALLAHSPQRVVAVDLSTPQIAALELRVAAYRQLAYPALLELLGVQPSLRRIELYEICRPLLSAAAQGYWDHHAADIVLGIANAGRFERYLRLFSRRILPWIHPSSVRAALLRPRTLTERCRFYTEVWDTWRWRLLFRIFFSRAVLGRLGRDPAFFRYVEGNVAERLLTRAREAMTVLDPMENPYLQWILLGHHGPALPAALRPENFQPIRRHLDRLEWHNVALEDYLADAGAAQFDGFNLSNIFEYMGLPAYHALLAQLIRAARPGARLVYWNLLAPRRRPADLAGALIALDSLAVNLHRQDRAFFYSALVIEQVVASDHRPVPIHSSDTASCTFSP